MNPQYRDIGEPADCLIEECAEVIHAICKAKRFGWDNFNPKDPLQLTNRMKVWSEIADLKIRIEELILWMMTS